MQSCGHDSKKGCLASEARSGPGAVSDGEDADPRAENARRGDEQDRGAGGAPPARARRDWEAGEHAPPAPPVNTTRTRFSFTISNKGAPLAVMVEVRRSVNLPQLRMDTVMECRLRQFTGMLCARLVGRTAGPSICGGRPFLIIVKV